MTFYRCGACAFFIQGVCSNIKAFSFGEKILATYFSCHGFEHRPTQIKEFIFEEKKIDQRKIKTPRV